MGLAPLLAAQDLTAATLNQLPVVVSTMATASVANSNAETVIGTFTIPAGTITAANQGLRYFARGTCGETGSPNITLRVRTGGLAGTLIAQNGPVAITAAGSWWTFDGWLLFDTVGAGGTYGGTTNSVGAFNGGGAAPPSNQTFDTYTAVAWNTTTQVTLVVTAQFSVAAAANTAAGLAGNAYMM